MLLTRERLEAIEAERLEKPAVFTKDAPQYYMELLPAAKAMIGIEEAAKKELVKEAPKKAPPKRLTIKSPAKKIVPSKKKKKR